MQKTKTLVTKVPDQDVLPNQCTCTHIKKEQHRKMSMLASEKKATSSQNEVRVKTSWLDFSWKHCEGFMTWRTQALCVCDHVNKKKSEGEKNNQHSSTRPYLKK